MELLLLEDINGVGKKNDIVVVGDGFALNHLLPARRALVATPTVRKRYADAIKRRAEERETERKIQQQVSTALSGKTVTISKKATKTGKLYAAVTAEDISTALNSQHGLEMAADDIVIETPIKALGPVTVQIQAGNTTLALQVQVIEEKVVAKKE